MIRDCGWRGAGLFPGDVGYLGRMADAKGKVKEKLGWLTGDRKVEAEGRAEQGEDGEPTEQAVEEKTDEVRRQYGETPDGSEDPDARH
jgi:uncharacterized protein YjbJ (UPF0337 family)